MARTDATEAVDTAGPLLRVEGVSRSFRGVAAVADAGLEVERGGIHGIIGPNGAGKTTLLNIISGYVRPDTGTVAWAGRDITGLRPEQRSRLGMVRTFQDCRLLEDLTVAENLWLGTVLRQSIAHDGDDGDGDGDGVGVANEELLGMLGLERRLGDVVRDLSSGERKAVEVGRALIAGAVLLLLDEPFSGLTKAEVDAMLATLRDIRQAGTCSILLIEHNLGAVFELCDRVTAMDKGAVVVSGAADEVKGAPEVKRAFFGVDPDADTDDPDPDPDTGDDAADEGDAGAARITSVADRPAVPRPAVDDAAAAALAVRDLHAGYGRVSVIHGVNLDVRGGEIVGLIGANGAGKTTIFRSVMGLAAVHRGEVVVDGEPLPRIRPDLMVAARVSFCTQTRNLFPSLTVEENLRLGARAVDGRAAATVKDRVGEVLEMLPAIAPFARRSAGMLSGGQQQLLAIGRALMSRPRVLLLDEPSTGLAVGAVSTVAETLRAMSADGLAVLVAEQNISFAASVCDRGYVIESGRVAAEGSQEVLARAWELSVQEGDAPAETLSAEQLLQLGGQSTTTN